MWGELHWKSCNTVNVLGHIPPHVELHQGAAALPKGALSGSHCEPEIRSSGRHREQGKLCAG